MSNTNKIISAIAAIAIIAIVYIYMRPGPSPSYNYPTPSASPYVSYTPSPSPTESPQTSPVSSPKPSASPKSTPTPSSSPKVHTFNISAVEFGYSPNLITVKSGETVKINFSNDGTIPHNLTLEGLNVATKTINPGQTDTIQFTAPAVGIYTFFCSIDSHRDLGLSGLLKVE